MNDSRQEVNCGSSVDPTKFDTDQMNGVTAATIGGDTTEASNDSDNDNDDDGDSVNNGKDKGESAQPMTGSPRDKSPPQFEGSTNEMKSDDHMDQQEASGSPEGGASKRENSRYLHEELEDSVFSNVLRKT